jgi:excisionase family DNA binding protein
MVAAEIDRTTPYDALPQWLTVAEAATYTGTSSWFVYKAIHDGTIPARRIGPKLLQIPKEYFHPSRAQKQVTP